MHWLLLSIRRRSPPRLAWRYRSTRVRSSKSYLCEHAGRLSGICNLRKWRSAHSLLSEWIRRWEPFSSVIPEYCRFLPFFNKRVAYSTALRLWESRTVNFRLMRPFRRGSPWERCCPMPWKFKPSSKINPMSFILVFTECINLSNVLYSVFDVQN